MIHFPILVAQATEVISAVDKLSNQNDRYLFIASQVVIILGGAAIIRWLVNSLERKDAAHAEATKALHAEMKEERESFSTKFEAARAESRAIRESDKADFLRSLQSLTEALKIKP